MIFGYINHANDHLCARACFPQFGLYNELTEAPGCSVFVIDSCGQNVGNDGTSVGWSTYPPLTYPPQKYGLIKGLLTIIGFP